MEIINYIMTDLTMFMIVFINHLIMSSSLVLLLRTVLAFPKDSRIGFVYPSYSPFTPT